MPTPFRLRQVKVVDVPSVSRRQARLALTQAGKISGIETAILSQPESVQIWYQDSPIWHRDHPMLLQLANTVGMSATDVDNLFTLAKTL